MWDFLADYGPVEKYSEHMVVCVIGLVLVHEKRRMS